MSAPGWLTLLALVLITSFGPWALPQMVQKFYSIRSKADVTRAMTIASVFALFMAFGAYYSGALTHLFYTGRRLAASTETRDRCAKGPIWDKIMPHFITTSGLARRAGDGHRADGLLGLHVQPVVAGAGVQFGHRH